MWSQDTIQRISQNDILSGMILRNDALQRCSLPAVLCSASQRLLPVHGQVFASQELVPTFPAVGPTQAPGTSGGRLGRRRLCVRPGVVRDGRASLGAGWGMENAAVARPTTATVRMLVESKHTLERNSEMNAMFRFYGLQIPAEGSGCRWGGGRYP